ncbi:glutamine synthetase family protein [Parasalinivibrio latis]|uniref:glutamine synthetase family protein n=1 Tax=Parasalinivibrio latis TaxID=2952610 RepID=UPI0030E096C4
MMRYQSDKALFTTEDVKLPSTEEATHFLAEHPEIQYVDLLLTDMNGIIRGKRVERNTLEKAFKSGIALPISIYGMNIKGTPVEETGLGLEIGECDALCFPVPGTLSVEPWQKRPIAQLLMSMYENRETPFFADPRMILNRVLRQFKQLGITPVSAFELEFYLIDRKSDNGMPQPPVSPTTGKRPTNTQVYSLDDLDEHADLLTDIVDMAKLQGLPADTIIAESAPGQFEINLIHTDDAMASCDNTVLLKRVIKQVAHAHQLDTTFMAKPYADQAGNGMHVHISLIDSDGNNVFAASDNGEPNDTLRWALGGMLSMLPEYMAILCPNVNSYRRFSPEFYVPSSPTWGFENRTTALRIPAGEPASTRIEHRVAGTDANPYLMMAALLASIQYGIENRIEPPEAIEGNAYTQSQPSLPNNLRDALRELKTSETMASSLGRDFIDVYVTSKEKELEEFERTISPLEYDWYLHTV